MKITERSVGGVTVLGLEGKIVLGDGDDVLADKVSEVVARGDRKVVLDVAGVPYVDSAGLGELVRCHTRLVKAGGNIKMLHLTARLRDLLQITKLVTVFETFESEDEAVSSF